MEVPKKKPGVGFGVMLLRNERILLGKRHGDPTKADSELHGEGTWTMPGGKLEFLESFETGVAREVLEETGIAVNIRTLKLVSVSNDMVHDAHFVTIGFHCSDFRGEPRVMEPDEITEWKWFPLDALPAPLYFPSERVLRNYLDGQPYHSL